MTPTVTLERDERLVVELAAGRTVREAAEIVGLSERTVYRRLEGPEFRRRVSEVRSLFVSEATGRLATAATAAVDCLVELLKGTHPAVRLGAAKAILELGARFRTAEELEQRLIELEARLNEQQS